MAAKSITKYFANSDFVFNLPSSQEIATLKINKVEQIVGGELFKDAEDNLFYPNKSISEESYKGKHKYISGYTLLPGLYKITSSEVAKKTFPYSAIQTERAIRCGIEIVNTLLYAEENQNFYFYVKINFPTFVESGSEIAFLEINEII